MKFLVLTAATLSIAAVTAIATSATDPSSDPAMTSGKPAHLLLAGGRYRRCQENLGYGRTGSYGCG
jgi:hypothetical protein